MKRALRTKHRAYQTEKTYLAWTEQFRTFVNEKSPAHLTETDLERFLSHLATVRHVSASTQNQALNALIFFYRHTLGQDLTDAI